MRNFTKANVEKKICSVACPEFLNTPETVLSTAQVLQQKVPQKAQRSPKTCRNITWISQKTKEKRRQKTAPKRTRALFTSVI